jgi:hypothetical protein
VKVLHLAPGYEFSQYPRLACALDILILLHIEPNFNLGTMAQVRRSPITTPILIPLARRLRTLADSFQVPRNISLALYHPFLRSLLFNWPAYKFQRLIFPV